MAEETADDLTASAVMMEIRPHAVGETFPDLGSHDDPVPPADVLDLVVHR